MFLFILMAELPLVEQNTINLSDFEIFNQPAFAVIEDGTYVVGSSDLRQLLFIAPDGTLKTRAGRGGQGPGEFQQINNVSYDRETHQIGVVDWSNRRFEFWTPEGEHIKAIPFPPGMLFGLRIRGQQLFFSRDLAGHFDGNPRLMRGQLESNDVDQIWNHKLDKPMQVTAASVPGGQEVARLLSWDPRLVFDVGADFIAISWNDDSKIEIIGLDGRSITSFSCPLPQFPLTDDDVADQVAQFDPRYRAPLAANIVRRAFWPALSSIAVDRRGNIWAFGFQNDASGSYPFAITSQDGTLLAQGDIENVPNQIDHDRLHFTALRDDEVFLVSQSFQPINH